MPGNDNRGGGGGGKRGGEAREDTPEMGQVP